MSLLTAKLSLEAELSRPMASLLMGYVARWEQAGGALSLTDRLSAQASLRALLERHYARTVSVVLGQRPTPATTIGTVALSMAHGERLRARAHARAILILRSMDRDLAAAPSVKAADALSQIETKDEPTGRIGYSTRLRATAAQAYFKLRAKLRAIVNAETEEPAEEAMFEWVTQGKANAPVVKAWVTVGDERVRDSHVAAGETYGADGGAPIPVDQAFQLAGGQVRFPGDTSLGVSMREIYNCFPAGTRVSGNIAAATRHWYEGDLIEITTSSGHKLSGTPNHPILTPEGWVALGALSEGSNIICRGIGRIDKKPALDATNIDDIEPTIEQVFDALERSRVPVRVSRLAVDFHGDRPAQDVDIVGADRHLRMGVDGSGCQKFDEFSLALALEGERVLSSGRFLSKFAVGDRSATASLIRAESEHLSLMDIHVSEPNQVGFGPGSGLDTRIGENSNDSGPRKPNCFRDGKDRVSRLVERQNLLHPTMALSSGLGERGRRARAEDASIFGVGPHPHGANAALAASLIKTHTLTIKIERVANLVRRQSFAGHVYNLETVHGMYYANGVVASNCRCSLAYYAQTPDGLVPLTLTTPTLPTRKPWRPGHRFGEEIPVRATESVTLNGRTRARVVLGDNRTFATLSQTSPSTITVTIDGQAVARATHANGVVTQIVVAPGRESLGIERLIRESVVRSHRRRVTP